MNCPAGSKPEHLLLYEDRIFVAIGSPGISRRLTPRQRPSESIIGLDRYEATIGGKRRVIADAPRNWFSRRWATIPWIGISVFVLAIDIATQSIVKRIPIQVAAVTVRLPPHSGTPSTLVQQQGQSILHNRQRYLPVRAASYPGSGRGCGCILAPVEAASFIHFNEAAC